MLKNFVRVIFGCVSAIVIYKILKTYNFGVLKSVTLEKIAILSLATFLMLIASLFYVKYIFKAFRIELSLKNTILMFAVTQIVSNLRGAFTGPLAIVYLRKNILGITYKVSLFISSIEAFIRFVILAFLSIVGALVIFGWKQMSAFVIDLAVAALVFLIFMKLFHLTPLFSGKLKKFKIVSDILGFIKEKSVSIDVEKLISAIVLSVLVSLLNAAIFSILLNSFHYSLNIFLIWCISAISLLAGIFSMIPFGLGTQDLAGLLLFMMVGIDKNSALSCILISRFFTTIIPSAISIIVGNFFSWNTTLLHNNNDTI